LVNELLRSGSTDIYRQVTEAVDRVVLDAVLAHTKGNQVRASVLLGISRTTLRARLNTLGMGGRAPTGDEPT
jgi:two-component system nitrogen regulation response regulator GlnG